MNPKCSKHPFKVFSKAEAHRDQIMNDRLAGMFRAFGGATPLIKVFAGSAALLALGACTAPTARAPDQPGDFIEDLPEQIVALAAPQQDLKAVRLMPEDGCYWYRHVGPVETTMLPLRTTSGSPICTRPQNVLLTAG